MLRASISAQRVARGVEELGVLGVSPWRGGVGWDREGEPVLSGEAAYA